MNSPPARGTLHAPNKEGQGEVAAQARPDLLRIETTPCPSLCTRSERSLLRRGLDRMNSPPARGMLHAPNKEGPPSLCYGGQSWGRWQLSHAGKLTKWKPPRAPPCAEQRAIAAQEGT